MGCEIRGNNTIVCGSRRGRQSLGLCEQCRQAEATVLCDGPLPAGIIHRRSSIAGADTTCSHRLCRRCAHHVTPDHDYCAEHAPQEVA